MSENTKLNKVINEHHFRVAIFGSARIKKDGKYGNIYKKIHELAELIAKENIDIVTGGGPGLMQAASEGHRVGRRGKKLHSVGLNILLPKEQKANQHLDIKKDFKRFSERLDYFMVLSHAVVVAPGGIGTLLEFFYTWQLVQVEHICHIPIILLGKEYTDLIQYIKKWPLKNEFMDKTDLDSIYIAHTPEQAMEIIEMAHKAYQTDGKNYCLNYKKYRIR